jgi:SAP domain-containing ribonucleoprotein
VSSTTAPVATPALTTTAPNTTSSDPVAATATISATGLSDASKDATEADPASALTVDSAIPEVAPVSVSSVFAANLPPTDAKTEAEKRAARAKKFGLPEDSAEAKKAARATKFGVDEESITKSLDAALPERREKKRGRGKEEGEEAVEGERAAKKGTPGPGEGQKSNGGGQQGGRRGERKRNGRGGKGGAQGQGQREQQGGEKKEGGQAKKVNEDPEWKAKLEARAKRFAEQNNA